jgi:phosphomannomutase
MDTSKSSIDSPHTSSNSFAMDEDGIFRTTNHYPERLIRGDIALGQVFNRENSNFITWLETVQRPPLLELQQPRLLVERIGLFPSSGIIRRVLINPSSILAHLKDMFINGALDVDESNGLNITFAEWRFKISISATESTILLNVESRGDIALMHEKTKELLNVIDKHNSHRP